MTIASDVRPVRRFYLGLTAGPYDALSSVTWTQIPNYRVKTSTLRWGAQHELARVEPSYASLLIDNRNAAFEPLNTSGPYYPNLRPGNRLRIVDTWAGVDYIRFTGYVTSWPRSWAGINQAIVNVEAYDALGAVLNSIDIPAQPWEMETRKIIEQVPAAGKAVWLRLGESSGTVAADSSGYGLDGQYQGAPTFGGDGLVGGDTDKATKFVLGDGARVSLPYKNLISQYPWSMHFLLRHSSARTYQHCIVQAFDGPSTPVNQLVEIYIEMNGGPATPGTLAAAVKKGTGFTRFVCSTVTVDDLALHRCAIVMASATSLKVYVDNVDVTSVITAGSPGIPDDLLTGYAIGNTPAVVYGDFGFSVDTTWDVLDEVLILDGYALTTSDISSLNSAAFVNTLVSPQSGQRARALLGSLGWPLADTDIDDGVSAVQAGYVAGKASAYLSQLDLTEGGRLFVTGAGVITFHDRHRILQPPYTVSQATFGQGAGEIGYMAPFNHGEDDHDIYNDVPVGNVGGAVQVARSVASRDLYGWKTLSGLTGLLGTSDAEARDRANRDLALYSQPVTRIRSITIKPQEDAAQGTAVWPAILGLGQNSRVTVKAQPPGAPMITQESHVEHCDETVTPTDWQITLGLSAAQTEEFCVLGTSALDTGTRLAY